MVEEVKGEGIDFKRRFLTLLSYQFRGFQVVLALSILEAIDQAAGATTTNGKLLFIPG